MISAAVLGGWGVGALVEVPRLAMAVLTSFLAGGIVLNVLKEELPEERRAAAEAPGDNASGPTPSQNRPLCTPASRQIS